jgi:RNA polymerase sigma-70 factor (ECF subfamily)
MNAPIRSSIHASIMDGVVSARLPREARVLAVPARTFEAFYAQEHGRLYRALRLVTGDREEAEDAMHDAFIRLLERWERVGGLEDPVGYLYRTALNTVRLRARRTRLAARRLTMRGAVDPLQSVEDQDRVDRALALLTLRQRAALVLVDLYRFTSEEAGRILGVSPVTVRRLVGMARRRLRASLEGPE